MTVFTGHASSTFGLEYLGFCARVEAAVQKHSALRPYALLVSSVFQRCLEESKFLSPLTVEES